MDNPFDLVTEQLDQITALLAKVGIGVSPLHGQLMLLVLILVLLVVQRNTYWPPNTTAKRAAWVWVAPIALVAIAIVGSWAGQLLNPPAKTYVNGTITAENLAPTKVELLSLNGEGIGTAPPDFDTRNGSFFGQYEFGIGHYPRSIRVEQPGCKAKTVSISLNQLRSNYHFQIDYRCEPI